MSKRVKLMPAAQWKTGLTVVWQLTLLPSELVTMTFWPLPAFASGTTDKADNFADGDRGNSCCSQSREPSLCCHARSTDPELDSETTAAGLLSMAIC